MSSIKWSLETESSRMTSTVLPTSVIGSYALPSWLSLAREAMAAGHYGERDLTETLEDATRIAIGLRLIPCPTGLRS